MRYDTTRAPYAKGFDRAFYDGIKSIIDNAPAGLLLVDCGDDGISCIVTGGAALNYYAIEACSLAANWGESMRDFFLNAAQTREALQSALNTYQNDIAGDNAGFSDHAKIAERSDIETISAFDIGPRALYIFNKS